MISWTNFLPFSSLVESICLAVIHIKSDLSHVGARVSGHWFYKLEIIPVEGINYVGGYVLRIISLGVLRMVHLLLRLDCLNLNCQFKRENKKIYKNKSELIEEQTHENKQSEERKLASLSTEEIKEIKENKQEGKTDQKQSKRGICVAQKFRESRLPYISRGPEHIYRQEKNSDEK